MNIAVCGGSYCETEQLRNILEEYFFVKWSGINVSVCIYTETKALFDDINDGINFLAVFMEVRQSENIDIKDLYLFRDIGYRGDIVLYGSSADLAVVGYEVNASGFLIKPFKKCECYKAMDRILCSHDESAYIIRHKGSIFKIPVRDIAYVESCNSKCIVHTIRGNNYTVYKKLNDIEKELSDKRFLRCHRSYLVNMSCVVFIDKYLVLTNGDKVLIRQKSLKNIKDKFVNYTGVIYQQ